jgi:hypothetical protein
MAIAARNYDLDLVTSLFSILCFAESYWISPEYAIDLCNQSLSQHSAESYSIGAEVSVSIPSARAK